jgi:hypothetical protein
MIDTAVYAQLQQERPGPLYPEEQGYNSVTGNDLKIGGTTVLLMELAGQRRWIRTVVADIIVDGILGLETLAQFDCDFKCKAGTMTSGGVPVPLRRRPHKQVHEVQLVSTVVLPGRSEVMVEVQVSDSWDTSVPEEGELGPLKGGYVLMGRALVAPQKNRAWATLINLQTENQEIPCGTQVGTFEAVEQVWDHTEGFEQENGNRTPGQDHDPVPCLLVRRGSAEERMLPEHLAEVLKGTEETLTEGQQEELKSLLYEFRDIFMEPGGPLGKTALVQHTIETGEALPIKQAIRRTPHHQQSIVDAEVEKMQEAGVIRQSDSPWSSPIVLVRKKDGTTRFCVDYRRLNQVTRGDAYPLPRIDESFDTLAGSTFFSTLDLASGYWQVEMSERDRPKTAFATRAGLFEFNVMPFGLATAPATFERLMELALRGLQWNRCLIYLDDVITLGPSFSQALHNLGLVFERFREAGLKLKPGKCHLFRKEVAFLGHIVSGEGVRCDPDKIAAVRIEAETR